METACENPIRAERLKIRARVFAASLTAEQLRCMTHAEILEALGLPATLSGDEDSRETTAVLDAAIMEERHNA